MAIGRITGRMLKTPLERNSTDLVISTTADANTLKIDATNGRVGISSSAPSHRLTVDTVGIQDNKITTNESNANLELSANGTGKVSISGLLYPSSDGISGQVLQTDGAGNVSFADLSVGDLTITGSTIATPSNADLTLSPGGTGSVVINSVSIRDNIIQTNESNANLQLSANGTGTVLINSLAFPTGTGSNGQVLATDGAGNVSFTDIATTLDAVTTNGATTTNAVTVGGLTSNGNVVINGEISSADSTAIQINDGVNISGVLSANTIDTNVISSSDSSAIQIQDSINLGSNTITANTGNFTNFTLSDTLTVGSQIIYAQGNNGFSVNEDFDPSNSSTQTAYHYTTGAGRETLAFTLARTGQFTDGFGIYGTSADNTFVTFGEQSNTSFEWRRGVGIRPLDLDGGTLMMRLSSAGDLTINNDITVQGSVFADSIQSTGSNANIVLDPQGSGKVILSGLSFPTADGSNGQVLATDGAGNVSFTDIATTLDAVTTNGATTTNAVTVGGLTSTSDVTVTGTTFTDRIQSTGSNANIVLDPQGTGVIDASSVKIINVADPTGDQHAATKAYVDTQISSNVASTDLDWGSVASGATGTEDFGVLDGSTEADTFIDYGSVVSSAVISTTAIVDGAVNSEKIEDGALIARHIDTTSLVLYRRWEVKTASFVSVNGGQYFVDTTGGAVTVTLPASPSVGDHVSVIDSHANAATNNITIDRNGSNIMGSAADDVLNTNNARRHLAYVDSTRGWIKVDGNT